MNTIQELVTGKPVLTLDGSASVMEAARLMRDERIGCVMIVTDTGGPAGIFTERDLMTRVVVAEKDPRTTRIEEVMTSDLYTATPEFAIDEACAELQKRHVRHLPVVESGKVVALLSLRDILRFDLARRTGEVEALTEYIQGQGEAS